MYIYLHRKKDWEADVSSASPLSEQITTKG